MIPMSHSDDSFEIENLDSTDVPEYKGKDESPMETGKEIPDSCATEKDASTNGQLPQRKKVNEIASRNSESGTRWPAGSRHRFGERNRSAFSRSKQYRDRQWRDEQYRQKVECRRQKLPSGVKVREHGNNDCSLSGEMVNGKSTLTEQLLDRVNRQQSSDYKTDLLAESRDRSSAEYARPSGRKQNTGAYQRRKYHAHGRDHFSSAYSHYSDDYDDYDYHDDYVSEAKRYRDPERNRRPKSVKANAVVVSNDVRSKRDEEDGDPCSDRAACSSAVSSVSNRPNKSQIDDTPRQRRNNDGYRIFRITGDRQGAACLLYTSPSPRD